MKTIEQLIEQRDKLKKKADELNQKLKLLNEQIEDRKSREVRDKINVLDLSEDEYKKFLAFLSQENKEDILKTIDRFKAVDVLNEATSLSE